MVCVLGVLIAPPHTDCCVVAWRKWLCSPAFVLEGQVAYVWRTFHLRLLCSFPLALWARSRANASAVSQYPGKSPLSGVRVDFQNCAIIIVVPGDLVPHAPVGCVCFKFMRSPLRNGATFAGYFLPMDSPTLMRGGVVHRIPLAFFSLRARRRSWHVGWLNC